MKVESVQPPPVKKEETTAVDLEHRKKIIIVGVGALLVAVVVAAGWYARAKANRSQNKSALSLAIATPAPVIAETSAITPTAAAAATATSTSTPAATPFAATTPVAIPLPPSPPPTPVNAMITDDEVQSFILDHYRATERKDLNYMLSQYDELVDFHTDGRRDKAWLRNDYLNYFQRWPIASFTVSEVRVIHSPVQNTVTAYFEIRFSVRDTASNRSKQGRASEEWIISKPFGALKIIAEKETVHGEAPERRHGRP